MKIIIQFMKHKISANGVPQTRPLHEFQKWRELIRLDLQTRIDADKILRPDPKMNDAFVQTGKG